MHFPFSVLKSNPAFSVWVGIAFYHREIKANNADFRKTQCFTVRTEHILLDDNIAPDPRKKIKRLFWKQEV
jgi:hypothetical protein